MVILSCVCILFDGRVRLSIISLFRFSTVVFQNHLRCLKPEICNRWTTIHIGSCISPYDRWYHRKWKSYTGDIYRLFNENSVEKYSICTAPDIIYNELEQGNNIPVCFTGKLKFISSLKSFGEITTDSNICGKHNPQRIWRSSAASGRWIWIVYLQIIGVNYQGIRIGSSGKSFVPSVDVTKLSPAATIDNCVFVCMIFCIDCLINGLNSNDSTGNPSYTHTTLAEEDISANHKSVLPYFGISVFERREPPFFKAS